MEQADNGDNMGTQPQATGDLPQGDHPLEIAARKGVGPLSPSGGGVWHGRTAPCVSCGQLVPRGVGACDSCGQDLSPAMIERMKAHAGPWYVLEHVRPFPGVTLERIVRQIRRGVMGELAIVRGPATDYQWRFAGETPGLCRYFGTCWSCHKAVPPSDANCRGCGAVQAMVVERAQDIGPMLAGANSPAPKAPAGAPVEAIHALSAAVDRADGTGVVGRRSSANVGGVPAGWLVAVLLAIVLGALVWFTTIRQAIIEKPTTSLPVLEAPTVDAATVDSPTVDAATAEAASAQEPVDLAPTKSPVDPAAG